MVNARILSMRFGLLFWRHLWFRLGLLSFEVLFYGFPKKQNCFAMCDCIDYIKFLIKKKSNKKCTFLK